MLRAHSIVWKLALPIPFALVLGLGLMWALLPGMVAENAKRNAIAEARHTVGQFKTLRAYYTEHVVKKAIANGSLKPATDHKSRADAIPVPATMIHDLSELLRGQELTVSLLSPFPFPNRRDRVLDEFQQQAWDFLQRHPDDAFVRQERRGDQEVVRVAVADRMVSEACIACHNSHPQSPKTDWKLNDVRGVLEVTSGIGSQLAAGADLSAAIRNYGDVLGNEVQAARGRGVWWNLESRR
jgi:hypothetical protein